MLSCWIPYVASAQVVNMPDANLAAAVRGTLDLGANAQITPQAMQKLTVLFANERKITDLTGLEHAKQLTGLYLNNNLIRNIKPLENLTNLKMLSLSQNHIGDVNALAGLTQLIGLSLNRNQIFNLDSLAGLTNLKVLSLSQNHIFDVNALAGLTELERLLLSGNQISHLGPLGGLTQLNRVSLDRNQISNITPLENLTNLKVLSLSQNHIQDMNPLAGLTQMEELFIWDNKISNVSSLENLRKLKRLSLGRNQIRDVGPLANLMELEWLSLVTNQISDLTPLAGLTQLTRINLIDNNISDFSPMDVLAKNIYIAWSNNPGFPKGGEKITGPWLWVLVPGTRLENNTDFLARASGGAVKELDIATNGTEKGIAVADSVWTPHHIAATGNDNLNQLTEALGWGKRQGIYNKILYGCVALDSPREQHTNMFVGCDDAAKVWLNGKLVHRASVGTDTDDYQTFFPVTLKAGKNVVLVAVENYGGLFSGFFGFAPDTAYSVLTPDDTKPVNR